jgi:MFS family permease
MSPFSPSLVSSPQLPSSPRCYITPLFGAYIADTYWGRYKTISYSLLVALIGHILMIVSSIPGIINGPHSAIGVFALSLVVMGLGTGGLKANISPLVAEQYRKSRLFVKRTRGGERVIVDPVLTTSSIYMVRSEFTLLLLPSPSSFAERIIHMIVLLPNYKHRLRSGPNQSDLC